MQNPFQYGKVVSDPYFTDRDDELKNIIQEVENKHNLVLYSPRRYGKTSLIKKVAGRLQENGIKVIYIDFYQITSRESFIDIYTREIFNSYGKRWKTALEKFGALLKGLRPNVGIDAMGNPTFSISYEQTPNIPQAMESVLNLTEQLDKDMQWLIVFDEFQEITKLNGQGFENILRSVIQHHTHSSYIFSGSRYHMLLNIFNQPTRAFYRFGKIMQLEKISAELMSEFIISRFNSTNIAISETLSDQIITMADNIPNYIQYLASEIWQISYQNNVQPNQETMNTAMERMLNNLNDYFMQIWEGVSLQQKKILIALSKESTNIFSSEYHAKHHLGAISSSQRAINKLIKEQIIIKTSVDYEFGDPFFKLFIRLRITALR